MAHIVDSKRLQAFLKKREEWFEAYESNNAEPNSIERQIQQMVFSEMSHRVLIKEQRDQQNSDIPSSPILAYVLESSYYASQILAIRRLLDKSGDVYSLRRVLDNVKAHAALITREIYVSFDGTPYDIEPLKLEVQGLKPADSQFSAQSRCRMRHDRFDLLSEASSSGRSRIDTIHRNIFNKLESWLSQSGAAKLKVISNKYIAHAANPESRGKLAATGLDFKDVEAAQKAIIRVVRAIYNIILVSGVYSPVVTMHPLGFFGPVWNMSNMSMVESTKRMQAMWDLLKEERNKWGFGIDDDLFK